MKGDAIKCTVNPQTNKSAVSRDEKNSYHSNMGAESGSGAQKQLEEDNWRRIINEEWSVCAAARQTDRTQTEEKKRITSCKQAITDERVWGRLCSASQKQSSSGSSSTRDTRSLNEMVL